MAKSKRKAGESIVKEPEAVYLTKPSSTRLRSISTSGEVAVLRWLGGHQVVAKAIRSEFDLLAAGNEGLPKSAVDELALRLGISRKSMAEDVLDLSVKTLERKGPDDKLDKRTSSHAIEIAKLLQRAYEVFEDDDKVRRWMGTENRALNGFKPLRLMDTFTGLVMVNDVLGRIEEGVYS